MSEVLSQLPPHTGSRKACFDPGAGRGLGRRLAKAALAAGDVLVATGRLRGSRPRSANTMTCRRSGGDAASGFSPTEALRRRLITPLPPSAP